jgi:hypothetical protein
MRFDPSGLNRAFDRMEKSAKSNGKSVARNQAGFFVSMARKLGLQIAPTASELDRVYQTFGWRMKRRRGTKTPEAELARRKRVSGLFGRMWRQDKIEQNGLRIRVWIVNLAKYSGKVDNQKRVSKNAAEIVQKSFKGKLERLAKKVTSDFKS